MKRVLWWVGCAFPSRGIRGEGGWSRGWRVAPEIGGAGTYDYVLRENSLSRRSKQWRGEGCGWSKGPQPQATHTTHPLLISTRHFFRRDAGRRLGGRHISPFTSLIYHNYVNEKNRANTPFTHTHTHVCTKENNRWRTNEKREFKYLMKIYGRINQYYNPFPVRSHASASNWSLGLNWRSVIGRLFCFKIAHAYVLIRSKYLVICIHLFLLQVSYFLPLHAYPFDVDVQLNSEPSPMTI